MDVRYTCVFWGRILTHLFLSSRSQSWQPVKQQYTRGNSDARGAFRTREKAAQRATLPKESGSLSQNEMPVQMQPCGPSKIPSSPNPQGSGEDQKTPSPARPKPRQLGSKASLQTKEISSLHLVSGKKTHSFSKNEKASPTLPFLSLQ